MLISCICVTDRRPSFLRRAITCFLEQSYEKKELVISCPQGDYLTLTLVDDLLSATGIRYLVVERPESYSVGNARNQAIALSSGDYVCTWDDDDWYHQNRLSMQFDAIQKSAAGAGYHASILTRIILYDAAPRLAYLSFSYAWENTLLCKKEIIYQNQYANRNKGEDTHIVRFLNSKKFVFHIDDAPYLYIYIYHGGNTWDYKHYRHLVDQSEILEGDVTSMICQITNP